MSPSRRWLFLLPLLLFIALAALLWDRNGKDPTVLPSARIDQPFPAFALPDLLNPEQTRSQTDFTGSVALVNVWATWCVACLVEHPVLMALAEEGVVIHGINYKDDAAAAVQYLAENGNPFRYTVVDGQGDLAFDLGVYGAPETYLVDAQGRIRDRLVGVLDADTWTKTLKPRYDALRAEAVTP